MNKKNNLAIIIPAYKAIYLDKTLESIERQTCKDFNVYIGDDNSPYKLDKIVSKYTQSLNITYKRFDENLGGSNLIAQWNRCINMSSDEEWIWLFSDDDIMGYDCVECFYQEIEKNNGFDLYRFNINVIDSNGNKIKSCKYPEILSVNSFIKNKLSGKINSYVVEYIFRRKNFINKNGFTVFDLAWNSDDATWIKLGLDKGIKTIQNGKVNWRKSEVNISPNNKDIKIVERKIYANIEYLSWLKSFLKANKIWNINYYRYFITWYMTNLITYKCIVNKFEAMNYLHILQKKLNAPYIFYTLGNIYYKIKAEIK